jgi:hypothetical protein
LKNLDVETVLRDAKVLAREVVEAAIGTPLAVKLPKHKRGKTTRREILNFEIPKTTGVAAIVDDYSALGLALATKHDECQPYLVQFPSMVTSKPAIKGHFKTGQRRASETGLF